MSNVKGYKFIMRTDKLEENGFTIFKVGLESGGMRIMTRETGEFHVPG